MAQPWLPGYPATRLVVVVVVVGVSALNVISGGTGAGPRCMVEACMNDSFEMVCICLLLLLLLLPLVLHGCFYVEGAARPPAAVKGACPVNVVHALGTPPGLVGVLCWNDLPDTIPQQRILQEMICLSVGGEGFGSGRVIPGWIFSMCSSETAPEFCVLVCMPTRSAVCAAGSVFHHRLGTVAFFLNPPHPVRVRAV